MINKQNISVNENSDGTVISTFVPFTMVLSTSAFQTSKKIWKIVYDFGDGKSSERNLFTSKFLDLELPISNEAGDPRNYPVENTYFFDDGNKKEYDINISFYYINQENPETLNLKLDLRLPNTNEIFDQGEFFLVGTRMFGPKDSLLLILESKNPNYLIPVALEME